MADIRTFFSKEYWKDWWKPPQLRWWIDPSGASPKPWRWFHYALKSPISAHTISAILAFVLALWATTLIREWTIFVFIVAMAFKGQLQKADALFGQGPQAYNIRNVIWRTVIAAIAGFILIGGLFLLT